jgi:membrane protein
MIIRGFRVGTLLRQTGREIGEDRVLTLAASAAYNFFFSLFPLLLFLAPMLSLFGNKREMVGWILTQLMTALPPSQVEAMRPVLEQIVFSTSAPGLISVGLLLAAWSGSTIFGTLIDALNVAYDVKETRSWVRQHLIRLGAFIAGGFIMILSTLVFLKGEAIVRWVGGLLHLGDVAIWVWQVVQVPVALSGLVALAFLTFVMLPNVKQRTSTALFAAVVTTLLWVIATLLFRMYINHFPPNPAYGMIGGVIILLTWMYYTMFVVLVGGELASEIHHGTGAVAPNKGAIYLGRVVTGSGPGSPSVKRT